MREVTQKWLDNQNKTLRDQGLLRLDFLSAHNNNAEAHIVPMGSDPLKSNINEIKDIYPYFSANKNLAIPNIAGKEYLGDGKYRLYSTRGVTADYNINNGHIVMNGTSTGELFVVLMSDLSLIVGQDYSIGYYYISGTVSDNSGMVVNVNPPNTSVIAPAGSYNTDKFGVFSYSTQNILRLYRGQTGLTYTNYTFKIQLEQGSEATDYVVPQPNTGYVSTNYSSDDGEFGLNLVDVDLSRGASDLGGGWYRINNKIGITADYNPSTGTFRLNGTSTSTSYGSLFHFKNPIPAGSTISVRRTIVSGTATSPRNLYLTGTSYFNVLTQSQTFREGISVSEEKLRIVFSDLYIGDVFSNYEFKLMIEHGNKSHNYSLPNFVPLELNIPSYRSPLTGLTITWSKNFGYAVDYSVEYNGNVYMYYANTKRTVFIPIAVETGDTAQLKIKVQKWSKGGEPIRIERVFVGLHLIYEQNKIFNYAKRRINDVLSLELPQDEINFELDNTDRMFDPLWYNSYFKYLNEKTEVRVYSGFNLDNNYKEWIKNGTYYLTEWKAPNNAITATFTARDILNLLDSDEMYSKSGALTLDDYCDIILSREYKGVDNYEPLNLPVNPDGSKKWNIRKNLAVPDLTGKEYLGGGWYRIAYLSGRYDYRYNVNTGQWLMNGEYPSLYAGNQMIVFDLPNGTYTLKITVLSGTSNQSPFRFRTRNIDNEWSIFMGLMNNQTYTFTGNAIQWRNSNNTGLYDNLTLLLQIEQGSEATEYTLPIENVNVPVAMETRTKREVLQLLAQSVNAHIHLDDDANISFIGDTTGSNLVADKKVMYTKPEFGLVATTKKIIVPISSYASDPNEMEIARLNVNAGDVIELNHDIAYSGGRAEVSGGLTIESQDNTWFRSYKVTIGGTGSGELVVYRHLMNRTTIALWQDISTSGDTMTYENPMIDTEIKASRALNKIWTEVSNNRKVEFDLRIDPLFNILDVVSFPFKVLDLEQVEFMRIDELEINFNGAYKGKIKGVILSNYGGDLTEKTYIKHSKEFNAAEDNLLWHLLNK